MNYSEEEINKFRQTFRKRRSIRIGLLIAALFLMILVTILAFPTWNLFGMPKLVWAPYFYIIMFGIIIAIAFFWRCPVCKGSLGGVIKTKYCSKCGFRFEE